jgi:hypothetical protein
MPAPADLADYYPSWLSEDLLWDAYPWDSGTSLTLATFLAGYTLHDSTWVGLHVDPDLDGAATAIIRWDTFWTDGRVPFPGGTVAEWPFLLIRFHGVTSVRLREFERDPTLSPRTISDASSSAVGESKYRTVVTDIMGGAVEIDHAGRVDLVCLSRERQVHLIPPVAEV